MTAKLDELLSCGKTCGELVYMRNLPAPVYVNYVNSEINLRFAKSINYLITESEVVTGNSQTEALPY